MSHEEGDGGVDQSFRMPADAWTLSAGNFSFYRIHRNSSVFRKDGNWKKSVFLCEKAMNWTEDVMLQYVEARP